MCRRDALPLLALAVLAGAATAGCSTSAAPPGGRLTTSQQLLASEATQRALEQLTWPEVEGRKVFVDVASPAGDQERLYLENAVAAELVERGAILAPDVAKADSVLLVNADAIGIEQSRTFVGLPAIESALLPIGIPELTLYDSEHEAGYAKLQTVLTDLRTGGVVARSGPVDAETWARERTILVFPMHDSNTPELKEHPR